MEKSSKGRWKWYNPFHPPPAPPAFGSHTTIPERYSSIPSKLILAWLSPLLNVGFTRPLEVDDLWQLHEKNQSGSAADLLERHFYKDWEVKRAVDNDGDIEKGAEDSQNPEKPAAKNQKKKPSLVRSIHATYYRRIWLAGLFKLLGDTLQTTSPLVNKALLNWLTVAFLFAKGSGAGQADSGSCMRDINVVD